jgi:hypothetical protein
VLTVPVEVALTAEEHPVRGPMRALARMTATIALARLSRRRLQDDTQGIREKGQLIKASADTSKLSELLPRGRGRQAETER